MCIIYRWNIQDNNFEIEIGIFTNPKSRFKLPLDVFIFNNNNNILNNIFIQFLLMGCIMHLTQKKTFLFV